MQVSKNGCIGKPLYFIELLEASKAKDVKDILPCLFKNIKSIFEHLIIDDEKRKASMQIVIKAFFETFKDQFIQ